MTQRSNNRKSNESRPLSFQPFFTRYAEGSVLVTLGHTKVLCNTSVIEGTPKFLRDKGQGWLTAEYSMLPRATHSRSDRDITRGKLNGRASEIQRLLGRSLRNCIDLNQLGDHTLVVDCDVLQADGGTRTAALNGAIVSIVHALQSLQYKKKIQGDPLKHLLTAFSIGVKHGQVLLDLDYKEDASTDADCNIVLSEKGDIIEIQATGEQAPLTPSQLTSVLDIAQKAQSSVLEKMRVAIETQKT